LGTIYNSAKFCVELTSNIIYGVKWFFNEMRILKDFNGKIDTWEDKFKNKDICSMLKFYAKNCSTVEVSYEKRGVIQHFPRLPYCKFETDRGKESFLYKVNRDNTKTKCAQLH
jgi:hypothetical protein